jgi:hypothetical protein
MNLKFIAFFFVVSGFVYFIKAQDDIQLGNPYGNLNTRYNGGLYDYSDPNKVNIKVQLWGYVRFPGYYIVPAGISVNEIISFAGGPTQDANIDDIRVSKIKPGTKTIMYRYNYNDLMWSDDLNTQINYVPIEAGDIVVVPGEPRYFGRENFQFLFSIFTSLTTLAILIINITKK